MCTLKDAIKGLLTLLAVLVIKSFLIINLLNYLFICVGLSIDVLHGLCVLQHRIFRCGHKNL
jgi:hypothetical protein